MARGARKGSERLPHDMGGKEIQNVQCSLLVPLANGVADPGASKEIADAQHVHPRPDPAVEGSTLYPSLIPDQYIRDPVVALAAFGAGYGLPLGGDQWVQIGGISTWGRLNTNPVQGYAAGGIGHIDLEPGDRFAIVNETALYPGHEQESGIYEILQQGDSVSVVAIIRRTSDANTPTGLCHDMVFQVTGSGAAFEGDYFTLTTADPIVVDTTPLTFTSSSSYSSTLAYQLLTGPQLATQPVDNTSTLEMSWAMASGDAPAPESFLTIPGTPGIDAISTALWTFLNEAVWLDADPGGVTTLKWLIYDEPGDTLLFTAESPPIHVTTPTPLSFQGGLPAPISFSPAYRLRAQAVLHTTSATPVTIHLRYSSPSRGTNITAPFTMTSGLTGTMNHQELINRDIDVIADDDACHPWNALGPDGRVHTKLGAASDASGWVTMPPDASQATLALSASALQGVSSTGFTAGDHIWLKVTNASVGAPKSVLNCATLPDPNPDGMAQLLLNATGGVPKPLKYASPFLLHLMLDELGYWLLASPPVQYEVPS